MITKINKNNFLTSGPKIKKWLAVLLTIFLIIVFGLSAFVVIYQIKYEGKIYPGIMVGNINLGAKTQDQASKILEAKKEELLKTGLIFKAVDPEKKIGKTITVSAVASATDPDLAQRIFSLDVNNSLAAAYQYGRQRPWWQNLISQAKALTFGQQIIVAYELNSQKLEEILKISFDVLENPGQNARLIVKPDGEIEVQNEKAGFTFDYQQAVKQAHQNLANLKIEPTELKVALQQPTIFANQTAEAVALTKEIISTTTPTFIYENKKWPVTPEQLKNWLEFTKLAPGKVGLQFNLASTTEYLAEIAKTINIEPQDAKFKIDGKKVLEFQISREGKKLNLEKSYDKLIFKFFHEGSRQIELVVEITPPKVRTADANNLGIKDLLGRGVSNFAGSPPNRRHNIKTGADALNGILIEPGEEFSLLKALGEINAATGYLPELVIKGDRTVPEYGGGLCQIGTTAFRAALRSGLPITKRQNHSYRVVYYEPAGMDATIYNPSPDFRFINDTGAYILFTTKIEGDDLIFEFYGTPDGRQIEIKPDPPARYNITSPGEPKMIETEELPPGEKKQMEKSHKGADTYFDYIVTYPDGKKIEKRFTSHYVAWPEVWLVGRQATSTVETEEEKNSTPL